MVRVTSSAVRRQPPGPAERAVPGLFDKAPGGGRARGRVHHALYLAGIWHIFQASKPGGTRWSLPPFLLLVTGISIVPFVLVHGSFFYVAEILKTIGQVDLPAQAAPIALATRTTLWLFIAYGVLAVPTLIGITWLTTAIARGQTLYPRWVAFANPIVCMLAGALVDRVLPHPLALWLTGAGLSLGMLAFFALSTAVLWSPPLSAPQY